MAPESEAFKTAAIFSGLTGGRAPGHFASEKKEATEVESVKEHGSYDFVNHPAYYVDHEIETKDGTFKYETIEYLHSSAKRLSRFLSPDEIVDIEMGLKYGDGLRGGKPDGNKTPRQKIAEDCKKVAWYFTHAAETILNNDTKANNEQ